MDPNVYFFVNIYLNLSHLGLTDLNSFSQTIEYKLLNYCIQTLLKVSDFCNPLFSLKDV